VEVTRLPTVILGGGSEATLEVALVTAAFLRRA
jgi:hypothetical protein